MIAGHSGTEASLLGFISVVKASILSLVCFTESLCKLEQRRNAVVKCFSSGIDEFGESPDTGEPSAAAQSPGAGPG